MLNKEKSDVYRNLYIETCRNAYDRGLENYVLFTRDLAIYQLVCAKYSKCVVTLWAGPILLRERDSYLNGLRANMETIF